MRIVMKTHNQLIVCLTVLGLAACSKEETGTVQESDGLRTFTAGFIETRTNLAKNDAGEFTKMVWSAGDKIGVFDKNGKPQPFTTKEGGPSATFTGSATAPSGNWSAFYPYNEKASLTESGDLVSNIPEVQFAKKDGVSDNVTLMVASCDASKNQFLFTQVCGLIKIDLPEGCVSVTLENPANTDLDENGGMTGNVGTKFAKTTAYSWGFRYSGVTLLSSDGEGLEAGTYYMAVRPFKYTGKLLLTMRHKDGKVYIAEREVKDFSVQRGEILPLKVNPVWIADDGVQLHTGRDGDKFFPKTSEKTSSVQKSEDVKFMGVPAIRWELTSEAKWSGILNVEGSKYIDIKPYSDGNYAIEYYVKCEDSALNADNKYDELFWNMIGNNKYYPIYRRTGGNKGRLYLGISDNQWHRITFPLTQEFCEKISNGQLWRVKLGINPSSEEMAKAFKGSVFYFGGFRLVRKTGSAD